MSSTQGSLEKLRVGDVELMHKEKELSVGVILRKSSGTVPSWEEAPQQNRLRGSDETGKSQVWLEGQQEDSRELNRASGHLRGLAGHSDGLGSAVGGMGVTRALLFSKENSGWIGPLLYGTQASATGQLCQPSRRAT